MSDDIAYEFHKGLVATPDCRGCPLAGSKIIPPEGNPRAKIAIVGESPSYFAADQGRVFVGPSGQLLDKLLARADIDRSSVWLTNASLCLEGPSKVRMADGSLRRIDDIVKHKSSSSVLTVNDTGELTHNRITGWFANPLNGREIVKVRYKYSKGNVNGVSKTRTTNDHPFLTKSGFVPVRDLSGEQIATGQRALVGRGLQILLGTLLGDAHISNSRLGFNHAEDQIVYAKCKENALSALVTSGSLRPPTKNQVQNQYSVTTRATRWLTYLRDIFYPNDKKGLTEESRKLLCENFTPALIAAWYCDDGSLAPEKWHAEIAACGLATTDANFLSSLFASCGIETHVTTYYNQPRLKFRVLETKKLHQCIKEYVPPDLQYKLIPEFRGYFQSSKYAVCPAVSFYDTAIVEYTKPRRPTVYCIEVENTHNFLTTAGVVSNCKPKVVEIDGKIITPDQVSRLAAKHCKSRLDEELSIIRPRVIIGLGAQSVRSVYAQNASLKGRRGAIHTLDLATTDRSIDDEEEEETDEEDGAIITAV